MTVAEVLNEELRAGDVIVPWYEKRARVVSVVPYRGPFPFIFAIATLVPEGRDGFVGSGISLERGGYTKVVSRGGS